MSNMSSYDRYVKTTWAGQQLLKKHSLNEEGVWQIKGEDPNAELAGSHHQPDLGLLSGRLEDVIREAVEMRGFWQWGAGGDIIKTEIVPTRATPVGKPPARQAVYKWQLRRDSDIQLIRTMPMGAKIVRFALQNDNPTIWAVCNPAVQMEDRRFIIEATGSDVPADYKYVGSLEDIKSGMSFIWHLFEVPK